MTSTVSKVLLTHSSLLERELLRSWCETAAALGGSFSITQTTSCGEWWMEYVIHWPRNVEPPKTN